MARSIHHQTGWRRPYPNMLLQDADTLLRVTEYDFDLSDPGFLFYCEQRGVLHCMGGPGSRRREFIADTRLGFADLKADPYFQFAQEWPPGSGQRHRYTDAELETLWRIIRYDRARLQDAWELYRQDTEIMPRWVKPAQHQPVGDPPNEPLPDWTPMDVRERIEDAERCSEHLLRVGAIVRTSYGTGPYRIIEITDICRCPHYLDVINLHNDAPESEPHHHLTCVDAEPMPGRNPNTKSWLNGYRLDGTSVWTDDRLIFDGMAPDAVLEPEIPKQKSAKPKPGKAPENQLDLFGLLSLTN